MIVARAQVRNSPCHCRFGVPLSDGWKRCLACISHHLTVEARDTTAMTSLRLLAVLDVLFKYA